eukprot:241270_1
MFSVHPKCIQILMHSAFILCFFHIYSVFIPKFYSIIIPLLFRIYSVFHSYSTSIPLLFRVYSLFILKSNSKLIPLLFRTYSNYARQTYFHPYTHRLYSIMKPLVSFAVILIAILYTVRGHHDSSTSIALSLYTLSLYVVSGKEFTYDDFSYTATNEVTCPSDQDCVVNCFGRWACGGSPIYGPSNAALTVNCNGDAYDDHIDGGGACSSLEIHAEDSTELRINVFNEIDSLYDTSIYTPTNAAIPNTFIKCGIVGPNNLNQQPSYTGRTSTAPNTVCGARNTIYSKDGFESVIWTYGDTSVWALNQCSDTECTMMWGTHSIQSGNTMMCGDDYSDSCSPLVISNQGLFFNCDSTSPCYAQSLEDVEKPSSTLGTVSTSQTSSAIPPQTLSTTPGCPEEPKPCSEYTRECCPPDICQWDESSVSCWASFEATTSTDWPSSNPWWMTDEPKTSSTLPPVGGNCGALDIDYFLKHCSSEWKPLPSISTGDFMVHQSCPAVAIDQFL